MGDHYYLISFSPFRHNVFHPPGPPLTTMQKLIANFILAQHANAKTLWLEALDIWE
jgi:hypothetical protein